MQLGAQSAVQVKPHRIAARNRSLLLEIWFYAIVFLGVSVGSYFVVRDDIAAGKGFPLWAMITPVIGLGVVAFAVYLLWGWLKFGQSSFFMYPYPAFVGDFVRGQIEASAKLPENAVFVLKLSCVNRVVSGYGKSRTVNHHILWRTENTGVRQIQSSSGQASHIPVDIRTPSSCRPTDDRSYRDRIIWYLEIVSSLPGRDYAAIFEIPMLRTRNENARLEGPMKRRPKKMRSR